MTILRMGLVFAALIASVPAFANQTYIQGVEFDARGYTLPATICAHPGHWLRLGAMVLDPYNRPHVPPAEWIHWRVTQANNGNFIEWSPAQSPARGPFQRDRYIQNAILLAMPSQGLIRLELDAVARQARWTRIRIVDPRSARCQWGPQGMYLNGTVPQNSSDFEFEGQTY
jgi:hypothetical protein